MGGMKGGKEQKEELGWGGGVHQLEERVTWTSKGS